ncbi:uncharacterized protein [Physcomitrium patens]|uniref:uncharacterized protein isoform X1 n=1 Tax=Physcomitrium patens TaxID=3218 RepID=UPI000D17282A|nr:uncharacterized protein LOC112273457 isoform X2 [Physcomitrium patens]|eukprot:XP_024358042.1 uncharacterized protein LOC112273457 isoform X2 [Physcomitrella patens]
MESGATSRPGNRPRMFMCYLCGREYGTKSLPIHIPQCQKKWLLEEENKPKNHRRPLPPQPNLEKAISNGDAQAFDVFNSEALEAFEQTLQQCHHCQRRFLPKPYLHHQKGCTAVNPAKPAGTGLIPISLTNRLVPGAIAGSMHGNARTHVPLRLCKPAEKSKLANSVKMSRPVSARPVWTGAGGDDPSLFDVRDPGQSSNWNNNLCNETENCRKLTNPRPFSVHKGNEELKLSVALADDDKSQLADTFENLWQAHSRADNLRLPRRRSGGAQEWCSQGETNTSLSSRRDANPRPKSALSSQNRRPLSATCHDFQGHLLRDSRQAECNENCTLPESKCTGESREQRCHL